MGTGEAGRASGCRDHEIWEFGLGFRKVNHDFTVVVLASVALGSGL